MRARLADGKVAEVARVDADITFVSVRRPRSDGTHYVGEECHLTKELEFSPPGSRECRCGDVTDSNVCPSCGGFTLLRSDS